jgi:uncharacterized RDD family membrane protein YckC
MNDDDTYYDALGAEPEASRDELRSAYRERISELEAARERKGVNESQLQQNRDDVARVRAAWNVLSDPFQRKRYDEQLAGASTNGDGGGDDVELVDDEEAERPEVQLTGWRRLMAPPPKPTPKAGAGNGKQPPPRRPVREPTIPLPPGVRIAEPRARGMALLFDFAVVLVIYWGVLLLVPGLVNSDYQAKLDNSTTFSKLHDAQDNIDSANKDIADANKAIAKAEANGNNSALKSAQSDLKSAQDDRKSAQKDFNDAKKDVDTQFQPELAAAQKPSGNGYDAAKLQKTADTLSSDIRSAQYVAYAVVLVLSLLYLVPATAIKGRTLGMRGRKIRVIRVDGSPVGWYGAFARFVVPLLIALAIPTLGPLLGLGIVLWGYRDPNGQGIHDKLARTLVVADA